MSKQNAQTIKNFFEAVKSGNMSGGRAALDKNVEWIEPETKDLWFGGVHHGADAAMKEVVEPTFKYVDDFSITIDEYLDAGDQIVALGEFHGKGKETGKKFNIPVSFVCTVKDGKITKFRAYHNTAQWLEAVGQLVGR